MYPLQHNDQVHRARGPMGLTFEQPKSVNEGEDAEKPKDQRAPLQRLVMQNCTSTFLSSESFWSQLNAA